MVKQELGDWSVLLLDQVGLVKLLERVEFFKLSLGAGGVAQIFLWLWAGLVKLSLGVGRIGQNSFG